MHLFGFNSFIKMLIESVRESMDLLMIFTTIGKELKAQSLISIFTILDFDARWGCRGVSFKYRETFLPLATR